MWVYSETCVRKYIKAPCPWGNLSRRAKCKFHEFMALAGPFSPSLPPTRLRTARAHKGVIAAFRRPCSFILLGLGWNSAENSHDWLELTTVNLSAGWATPAAPLTAAPLHSGLAPPLFTASKSIHNTLFYCPRRAYIPSEWCAIRNDSSLIFNVSKL